MLDMRPDGSFRPAPSVPISVKLALGGVVIAALAVSLSLAAAAVWILSMLLPIIVIAGGIAWGALKWRQWTSLSGERHGSRRDTGTFRN